ncbi:GGDEF domain-containing protein [Oscillibacter sp.]|uniref:GGDEF domain-containing protein n=1 Tax=Oscillibacter sp. TaxID=1945593 RepID=UPI0026305494|nr:GGDEF domain-containing protein [Oscillibacter sp.]MDD3347975.1 GGDEF domain-containing protein [Oscillibacter sp.]
MVLLAEVTTISLEAAAAWYLPLYILSNVIGFSISPFIPLLIGGAISRRRKGDALLWILPCVNIILSVLSAAFPIIFEISAANIYARGPFWWFFVLSYVGAVIGLFFKTLLASKQYQNSNRYILYILFFFVVLGTSVQVFFPQAYLSWLCTAFAIGLYYIYYCELCHQIDGLTELLNRQTYESYLRRIRNRKNVMIIIFDIDDFKTVNDQYGHLFGDFCITAVSSCIKSVFSKLGLCFRTGGDEFCVISETANEASVQRAYHRFLHEIVSMRSTELRLPLVSIGYSYYNRNKSTIDEALSLADQRMYHFKQTRKAENSFTPSEQSGEASTDQFTLS